MALIFHIVNHNRALRRERLFRDQLNPVEALEDNLFIERYRFPKSFCYFICEKIGNNLERPTQRSNSLPVVIQVCVALRFLSHGSYLTAIGDIHHISKSSSYRCIVDVCNSLSNIFDEYVRFPINNEQTMAGFYAVSRLPKVIGAIDGTHIPIKKPSVNEHVYINRKGFHSINVMLICSHERIIRNALVHFPGNAHDSFILHSSAINQYFTQNHPDGWLVGDSGYALKNWLMTPVLNPQNQQQIEYNRRHQRARLVVEHCNGLLKQRFRCLHKQLEWTPQNSILIIRSCIVLHNLALMLKLPNPIDLDAIPQINEALDNEIFNGDNNFGAVLIRNELINHLV